MKGKREEHLNDIWRDMKVEQEKYFAGEALTWKTINKVHKDVEEEKFSFLEPFKDKVTLYNNHKTIFARLSRVHNVICTKNATTEELEYGAKEAEKFGHDFNP